jgi:uncharacterized protein DUF3300
MCPPTAPAPNTQIFIAHNKLVIALTRIFSALMLAASTALAQIPPPPPGRPPAPPPSADLPAFSQQELEQMLAPIALYPDPVLSQILMAATYPLEIVEAARWVSAYPGLQGDEAVRAVAAQPWDPSVKSLVAFPQILALMDQRLDWTQRLGNAFLVQQAQVMDTVQALRRRAQDAGNLSSSSQVQVEDQGGSIALEPADPQLAYIPYYDPQTIYGPWRWPDYPPVYWPAWPGYYGGPRIPVGLAWGAGVAISAGFFFGAFDWHQRRVNVVNVNNFYYRPGRANRSPGPWQHDAEHRRGVPYRGEAVRRQYGRAAAPSVAASRSEFRGREPRFVEQTARPVVTAPARPVVTAPAAPAVRPQARVVAREPAPRAFEGIHAGGDQTRGFSARGRASMQPHFAPAPQPAPAHAAPAGGGGRRR